MLTLMFAALIAAQAPESPPKATPATPSSQKYAVPTPAPSSDDAPQSAPNKAGQALSPGGNPGNTPTPNGSGTPAPGVMKDRADTLKKLKAARAALDKAIEALEFPSQLPPLNPGSENRPGSSEQEKSKPDANGSRNAQHQKSDCECPNCPRCQQNCARCPNSVGNKHREAGLSAMQDMLENGVEDMFRPYLWMPTPPSSLSEAARQWIDSSAGFWMQWLLPQSRIPTDQDPLFRIPTQPNVRK